MGFGAIIASGEKNELLADALVRCITEVRVEQFLDEPTRFAIRFQEDISGGEPAMMQAPELQYEQMMTIAVQVQDEVKCLVRGPITDIKCSIQLGGPGSWFEVHGQDRRVELNRQCFQHAWTGRASEAAETILSATFLTDIQESTKVYGEQTSTLNQRATDLEFISKIARQNNLHFWITYTCELSGLDPERKTLQVEETAHVKASPPRPQGATASSASVDQITLVPSVDVTLRVNVDKDQYQNVTVFEMDMDVERPNSFAGTAINDTDHKEDKTSVTDPQPAVQTEGTGLVDLTGIERQICIISAGGLQELQPKAEAALTDAGWFVNATASTTAFMLHGVLMPHDVVRVDGLGLQHSGAYQVKAVTHVINAADHFMDLELRRNAIGGA
jgi:hypothetical protein